MNNSKQESKNELKVISKIEVIALFTIIRTDRNMLLACYSHKHISYRIRTIIRKAITPNLKVMMKQLREIQRSLVMSTKL
ncbi:hypothetical protein [Wolbachia endosymbiont (group A) of Pherbina coryleti]|uniref:hypothetical protein n=1 Tax=Wolbachia endosymbiont (group A) of Pherbina coryleti TaxID=3066153 RepID=UPI00313310E7